MKKENIFQKSAENREREQAKIKKSVGLEVEVPEDKKVAFNIYIPKEYKEKLQKYATSKHMSASTLIQVWIDENCV